MDNHQQLFCVDIKRNGKKNKHNGKFFFLDYDQAVIFRRNFIINEAIKYNITTIDKTIDQIYDHISASLRSKYGRRRYDHLSYPYEINSAYRITGNLQPNAEFIASTSISPQIV